MGRERFLFLPSPLPCGSASCGSAFWAPDLTGRKSWRYSPECVEKEEFSEVRLCASGPRFLTTEAGGPLLYPPTTKTNRPPSDGVDRSAS
jgi:hypothetical protein